MERCVLNQTLSLCSKDEEQAKAKPKAAAAAEEPKAAPEAKPAGAAAGNMKAPAFADKPKEVVCRRRLDTLLVSLVFV